jgi:hypothetical protein
MLNPLDTFEIFTKISKYTGHDIAKGGQGLKINGVSIYPTICLEDAIKLAAAMGICIRYYTTYNSVAATHTIILHEVVETYSDTISVSQATIKAILTVAYKVSISGKR